MVDIDSETLFNGAAAAVATIAVLVFVLNVELGYSPVSEVALVAAFLAGVFALTQRSDDYQLVLFGYAVVVVSVVVVFFDVFGRLDLGDELIVLGLLAMAALLFWLRTQLGADGHFVTGRVATYAFSGVLALAVVVLVVDVATGGLAYELQHDDAVEFDDGAESDVRIGALTVTNPTPLPERVEAPRYEVCAAGNWSTYAPPSPPGEREREVHVSLYVDDGYDEHVLGFGSKSYPATLDVNGANLTDARFPIERTDECPTAESGDPYIALFEVSEDRRYGYAL